MVKRSKKSGRRASTKFLAAGNAWRAHVKETMRKNPKMKFGKSLLKLASRTYKKGSNGSSGVTVRTSKYDVHVKPRKTIKPRSKAKRKTKRAKTKKRSSRKTKSFFGF